MLGTCTLNLARLASLREAADVLRTDRRTRREDEKAVEMQKRGCCSMKSRALRSARRTMRLRLRDFPGVAEVFEKQSAKTTTNVWNAKEGMEATDARVSANNSAQRAIMVKI